MKRFALALTVLALSLSLSASAQAKTYKIDASHTSFEFAVKHLVISKTKGGFDTFSGTVSYDPQNASAFSADVEIDASSIDTKDEKRDEHLKSPDFFDVSTHPKITFKGTGLEGTEGNYKIVGDLTMKGVTKRIEIPAKIVGPVTNPFGGTAIGIEGWTKVNRQDFDISWSKTLDSGGLMVGDEVEIFVNLEAHGE